MKKFFALFLTLAMILSLAACGAKEESPAETPAETPADAPAGPDDVDLKELAANYDGEIVVTIWGKDSIKDDVTSRGYWVVEMAKEFSAMYDNVTVDYQYQGSYTEVSEKIMAAAAANDLPTAFLTEESMVKSFESIAADLHAYMPSATIENYMPGLLVSMEGQNGELLGAPFARSLPVLAANQELLAAAGWTVDQIKTNEDMFQCAKDIYAKTGTPGLLCFWDTDCWHWESAVYADGGSILSDDGSTVTFGKDYDYVGAKYVKEIQNGLLEGWCASPYGTPEVDSTRDDMFCSGEAAMTLWSCNSMPKRAARMAENGYTLVTTIQPAGEAGEPSVTGGGSNWVICDSASYEEKMFAGAFFAYLAEDDQVMRISENTGAMMITTSSQQTQAAADLIAEYPFVQAVYDSVPYLHTRPNTAFWTEMYTYGVDKLEQFALYPDRTDVEEMIDDMSTKFQQIIDDNTW